MISIQKYILKLVVALIVLMMVGALFMLGKILFPYTPDTVPLAGDLNYGLQETNSILQQVHASGVDGSLYMSVVETTEQGEITNVTSYRYDLSQEVLTPLMGEGTSYAPVPIDATHLATVVTQRKKILFLSIQVAHSTKEGRL